MASYKQGIVLPVEHSSDPNLVYVHFGDRTTNPCGRLEGGIWCHNALGNFTRYRDASDNPVSFGNYTPVKPYLPVMVLTGENGSSPMITSVAPTNTNTPDIENNDLHIIGQSAGGSIISIDDKVNNISLMNTSGGTSITLAENALSMEVSKGENSGKTGDTGIHMSRGSIEMRLKDSSMKLDESGFSVSFDGGGSYMKVSKQGIEFHGEDFTNFSSGEQISMKGSHLTLEGTKEASLGGNQVKVGGDSLLNLTGSQIDLRSVFDTQVSGLHVGITGDSMITMDSPIKSSTHSVSDTSKVGVSAIQSNEHVVNSPTIAFGASSIYQDGNVISNSGLGSSVSSATSSGSYNAASGTKKAYAATFTVMLNKNAAMAGTNKILSQNLAGSPTTAVQPSGNASNAKIKGDTKTIGSIYASNFMRREAIMSKYSITPNLISKSSGTPGTSYTSEGISSTSRGYTKLSYI